MVELKQEPVPVAEKKPPLLAEAGTPIQVLRKNVETGVVAKRLGLAFDAAFSSFSEKVKAEANEYNKVLRSSDPEEIRKWAVLGDPPKYMKAEFSVKWDMEKKHLREYGPELEAAYKENGIEGIADVVEKAKKEGVEIKIVMKAKVAVNSEYLAKIKATRKNFIENAVILISTGVTAGGKIEEPYPLNMGDKRSAKLFMAELQAQCGAFKPNDLKGVLPLERALANRSVIPENHYPLEVRVEGKNVIVDWASFIGKRTGVAMLVPEKRDEMVA